MEAVEWDEWIQEMFHVLKSLSTCLFNVQNGERL